MTLKVAHGHSIAVTRRAPIPPCCSDYRENLPTSRALGVAADLLGNQSYRGRRRAEAGLKALLDLGNC